MPELTQEQLKALNDSLKESKNLQETILKRFSQINLSQSDKEEIKNRLDSVENLLEYVGSLLGAL